MDEPFHMNILVALDSNTFCLKTEHRSSIALMVASEILKWQSLLLTWIIQPPASMLANVLPVQKKEHTLMEQDLLKQVIILNIPIAKSYSWWEWHQKLCLIHIG